jgi:hypothetical protein
MPLTRWAMSLLIVCHVTAVAAGSLGLGRGPLGAMAGAYLGAIGLDQRWTMFAHPPAFDQYVRVRYFVAPDIGADHGAWAATELVMPAHREDRVRLAQSFRDSYRDKAIAIAVEEFLRRPEHDGVARDRTTAAVPDDLAPVARYFAAQFARRHLRAGERIVRTEVWVGAAPLRDEHPTNASRTVERRAVLLDYYAGPIEHRFRVPPHAQSHAADEEADITWVLEYFEGA